jgi:hypothetical protein
LKGVLVIFGSFFGSQRGPSTAKKVISDFGNYDLLFKNCDMFAKQLALWIMSEADRAAAFEADELDKALTWANYGSLESQ